MSRQVYREKSPLSDKDCFVVFDRRKSSFTFPVHVHPEYELNFVDGAKGAQRIVGDSVEIIGERDLVFIANPELKHAWKNGDCKSKNIHEITIQFHPSLIEECLDKNQFRSIQKLFHRAGRGVTFGAETIDRVIPMLQIITMENDGFYSVIRLFMLLHELSKCSNWRELSCASSQEVTDTDMLLHKLQSFIRKNINEDLKMEDAAMVLNMSRSTFARFIKRNTRMNFSDYVMDLRINTALQLLKEQTSVNDIVQHCGFNSISYFYRAFKKSMGVTPVEFRQNYKKQHLII